MSCRHTNRPGYVFCGVCGEPLPHQRCRCGFAAAVDDAYCGQCGLSLAELQGPMQEKPVINSERRFDLEHLAEQAAQEKQFLETTHKARVTQDDIRKLLAKRRKKF